VGEHGELGPLRGAAAGLRRVRDGHGCLAERAWCRKQEVRGGHVRGRGCGCHDSRVSCAVIRSMRVRRFLGRRLKETDEVLGHGCDEVSGVAQQVEELGGPEGGLKPGFRVCRAILGGLKS